jgi:hypothetical protein
LGDIAHPDAAILEDLLTVVSGAEKEPRIMRAATYALAALHPEPTASLVERARSTLILLTKHSDMLTRELAQWGLVDRQRSRSRGLLSSEVELWGIGSDLGATLGSASSSVVS